MKTLTRLYSKAAMGAAVLFFPVLVGCSAFGGSGSLSNSPAVAAQQQEIEMLQREVDEAERYRKEAEQREKAAKNRLKAAEHELKALESQAKARGY
ncbi:hypothetical protein MKJ04_01225 [Pontibacter sp. E15-1]|uniref:hypothetical protein n=1 Tax=Pontibacter sp. E15-1 TaxID=2919918 RepID=UPI001F4F48CA|nr:hypothetical protein [Pontibacter sp. E15-1]MCJ8163442.1 hypothetical protein [Pontibacter sp. E15-1]